MDLLDELATMLHLDHETLFELRRQFGGESHYIYSPRRAIHERIRQSDAPATVIARQYGLHRHSVQRIRR